MKEEDKSSFQIELNPEVAKGTYANLAIITHSSSEFVLDFVRVLPGLPKPQVMDRIIVAPEHAKRLLIALQENVAKYESTFGRIDLDKAVAGRTIAPFGTPKGEA